MAFAPKDGYDAWGKIPNLCRMASAHIMLEFAMFLRRGGGASRVCRSERVGGGTRLMTSFSTIPHKLCKYFPIRAYHISMPRQRSKEFSARRCLR